jgi:hypothetical protein
MSIRPNPATIRPFSCLRFIPGPGCVSLVISGVYVRLVRAASASSEKYPAMTEVPAGRWPEVRIGRNPAKSGHYPANRILAGSSQVFGRKSLYLKHLRRHQASQIGRGAIYPAMVAAARDQWLVAKKRVERSPNSQQADVRKCPQRSGSHSRSDDAILCSVLTYGMASDRKQWLSDGFRMSGIVRNSHMTSSATALITNN